MHLFHRNTLLKPLIALLFLISTSSISLAETNCDSTLFPVIFVHGFMGAGDNWSLQARRFVSQG
jgi:hypothetical protein